MRKKEIGRNDGNEKARGACVPRRTCAMCSRRTDAARMFQNLHTKGWYCSPCATKLGMEGQTPRPRKVCIGCGRKTYQDRMFQTAGSKHWYCSPCADNIYDERNDPERRR